MNAQEYETYRETQLRTGAEFQDWIMERLHLLGVILQTYSSRRGQQKGENLLGLEIKNDRKMRQTGNICIEVAEKARPREGSYVESGIFRTDNTWLYGIGDNIRFYIFAKSSLRNLYQRRQSFGFREYRTETSKGFLVPLATADLVCARRITFGFDGSITEIWCGGAKSDIDLTSVGIPEDYQLRINLK